MSLVNVPIYIEDISTIACSFDFIDIYRAETKWGTYVKITDNNTHIELCEEQPYYEYTDENGSEYYWYKYKFIQTDGTESGFSQPIQAQTPFITYCGFEDVRRLLRAKDYEGRIRFSDSYRNLRKQDDAQGISLKALSISPEYSGTEEYMITFLDDTNFKMEVGEEARIARRYVGQGDINTDFIADDGSIRIDSADWSGTPALNEIIFFETDSHMSIMDALQFVRDAEILVDVILEENLGYTTPKDNELRFERVDVPKAVRASTARFASFLIYSTIYQEQTIPGLPGNLNDIISIANMRGDDISTLPKQAMRYLQAYINKYKDFFDPESGDTLTTAPRWINTETLFDAVGVAGVGEGVKLPSIDRFFDRATMSYAGLLDWDLLGLSTFSIESEE